MNEFKFKVGQQVKHISCQNTSTIVGMYTYPAMCIMNRYKEICDGGDNLYLVSYIDAHKQIVRDYLVEDELCAVDNNDKILNNE